MEDRKPNPKLLATWALAGAFLAASSWLVCFIPIPRLHANGCGFWDVLWMNSLRSVVLLAPFAIGMTVSLMAERKLKRGLQNEIWSEAQLKPVRTLITNPIWTRTGFLLIAAALLSLIFSARSPHPTGGLFIYALIIPTQTATRLRQLLAPPRDKSDGGLIDWQNFKPIQSDQWGQPPVHPS